MRALRVMRRPCMRVTPAAQRRERINDTKALPYLLPLASVVPQHDQKRHAAVHVAVVPQPQGPQQLLQHVPRAGIDGRERRGAGGGDACDRPGLQVASVR